MSGLPPERDQMFPADRAQALRLFVSVELSEAWRRAAEQVAQALQVTLGRDYRWVRPELYHVTLVFLGEQARSRLGDIEDALRRAANGIAPLELRLGDLSGFGVDVPRALILSVADPSGGLLSLRRRLDQELAARSIPYDRKPLNPHLTLGRARAQRGRDRTDRRSRSGAPSVPRVTRPDVEALAVDEIALVKSELLPGGPRYEALTRVPLGG